MVDQKFSVSVHIMTRLAYHKAGLMTSEELAGGIRTNSTVIRRLLARLSEAGLVQSFKGKTGGVKLARNPKEISLKDIYQAVNEKPLIAAPLKAPNKNCVVSSSMKKMMCDVVQGMEEKSLSYLSEISLADMLAKLPKYP